MTLKDNSYKIYDFQTTHIIYIEKYKENQWKQIEKISSTKKVRILAAAEVLRETTRFLQKFNKKSYYERPLIYHKLLSLRELSKNNYSVKTCREMGSVLTHLFTDPLESYKKSKNKMDHPYRDIALVIRILDKISNSKLTYKQYVKKIAKICYLLRKDPDKRLKINKIYPPPILLERLKWAFCTFKCENEQLAKDFFKDFKNFCRKLRLRGIKIKKGMGCFEISRTKYGHIHLLIKFTQTYFTLDFYKKMQVFFKGKKIKMHIIFVHPFKDSDQKSCLTRIIRYMKKSRHSIFNQLRVRLSINDIYI